MALKIEPPDIDTSSSDDECLMDIKRKVEQDRYECGSEDDIYPEVLLQVQVEEIPLDYSKSRSESKPSTSKSKNKQRRKQISPKKKKKFPCYKCNSAFDTAGALKHHSLEHQVQTRHKCEECGRFFKKSFSLRMHMRVHQTSDVPCPLCEERFDSKNDMRRHIKIHERKVECELCISKFHTKQQLHRHKIFSHGLKSNNPRRKEDANQSAESAPSLDTIEDCKEEKLNEVEIVLRRQDLCNQTQCAIVNKMHKGRSISDVCQLYNLTPEVVNEIWEDREKFALPKKSGLRSTKYMNSVLDNRILTWFNEQRANSVQVSGKMLQDTAEEIAKECGFVAFNGSKKWLDRFKQRYNITFKGTPKRDYHAVGESKWKSQFFKEQWSDVRLGIPDEDIYTADEVGLFYNSSNGRVKKLGGKKYIQGQTKDRLSIFLCTNVTGSDKKQLLVCGTEDPLIHSHRDPNTLPVTYIRQSQAHFTTQIFEEYVKYWNRQLKIVNRKAILVLDRATIHTKLQMSHLKLVFVPWKASSGLIPIKNGVYTKFRDEFRRLVLIEKAVMALQGIMRDLTCLEALNMLEKAWERLSPEVIFNSFESTGYDVQKCELVPPRDRPKVNDNDEEIICDLLQDHNIDTYYTDLAQLDQYLTVDEELVNGQGTNCSVFGGNHKVDKRTNAEKEKDGIMPLGTERQETLNTEVIMRRINAFEDLEIVRNYLLSDNTSYETFCSFMNIESFLMRRSFDS